MKHWNEISTEEINEAIKQYLEKSPITYVPTECCSSPVIEYRRAVNPDYVRVVPVTSVDFKLFNDAIKNAWLNLSNNRKEPEQPAEPDTEFISIMFEKE